MDFTLTYSPKLRPPPLPLAEVHVFIFDLVSSSAHVSALREKLSADELARAEKFHFPIHAERFVTTRGILRCLLSHYVDLRPDEIEFAYSSAGKPTLATGNVIASDGMHFNVSHSEDQCLIAFSHDIEIGADIESRRRDFSNMDLLAGRCLSDEDLARFLSLEESAKCDAFFRFWTRKEAMLKAIGVGLGHPLKSFGVSFLEDQPARLVRSDEVFGDADAWSLQELEVAAEYTAAIAIRSLKHVIRQLRRDEVG